MHPLPPIFVEGAALARFGHRKENLLDLIIEASGALVETTAEIDGIVLGAMAPEESLHERSLVSQVADRLGLSGIAAFHVDTASSSGAAAFHIAVHMVASGMHRRVLAIGAEKLTHVGTSASTETMSQVLQPAERLAGLTMPGVAALFTDAYLREYGIAPGRMREAMAAVAVKNHSNALVNPFAHLRHSITIDEYHRSRTVASPLCVLDCAPISDGAAAAIVTAESGSVRVVGIGQATDRLALCERNTLASLAASRLAAYRAYAQAGFGPEAVTFAELHDAFTCLEIMALEDVGLAPLGAAVEWTLAGVTALNGRIPINPSGGLKGRGHPVGASGLAQIVEMMWQIQGVLPSERQVCAPEVGLALSIGGPAANNFVTLLKRVAGRPTVPVSDRSMPSCSLKQPRPASSHEARGHVVSATDIHTVAPGFPRPTHLALVETRSGARVLARSGGIRKPLKTGQRVKLFRRGNVYRAEAVEWSRFARNTVIRVARFLRLPGRVALARALSGTRHFEPARRAVRESKI